MLRITIKVHYIDKKIACVGLTPLLLIRVLNPTDSKSEPPVSG